MSRIGVANSNPTEALDITGNLKASSNIYVIRRQAIGTSNPSESLDITGNLKASSNMYAMSRIGLGTSNPAYQLHASGTIASSNIVYLSDGTSLLPTISWSNDLDTGIYHVGNNSIGISTGGSNAITISNNKLGINTLNPELFLDVMGTIHISSNILFGDKTLIETINLYPQTALAVNNPSGNLDGITYTFVSTNQFNSWNGSYWYDYDYTTSLTCDAYVAGVFNGSTVTSNVDGSNVIRGQISGIVGSSNFILKGYRFENSNASTTTLPSKLYLLGSYDNSNWNTIDYYTANSNIYSTPLGTNITGLDRQIDNSSNYRYYRVVFNELLSGNSFVIQEFRWYILSTNSSYTNGLYYNSSNNMYGINTLIPQYTLDVKGNIASSNIYLSSSGTSTNPSLTWISSSNTGIYLQNQNMNMVTSSSNVLSLSNYKVGILSTQPTESLDIIGNLKASSNIYSLSRLSVGKSNPTEALDIIGNIKASSNIYSLSRLSVGKSNPTETLDIIGNIKASSNIYSMSRISVAKSNPTEALDIIGNIKASSNIYAISSLGIGTSNPSTSVEINATDAILVPKGTTAQRPNIPIQGQIRYNTQINTFEGYGTGNAWGSLGGVKDINQDTYISAEFFPTSNDDNLVFFNSNIETMRLTKQGYLGIGKSNPQYSLDVTGQINANGVLIDGYPLSTSIGGGFRTSNNNTVTYCNVGINNSNPLYPLDINGVVNIYNQGSSNWLMRLENGLNKTFLSHSDGKGIRIVGSNVASNSPSFECFNGSNILFYIGNNGLVGIGTSNLTSEYALQVNGAINASGSVTSSSDIRLKTNIKKIEDAISKIKNISGYTFNFKNEINKKHIGLIAQEVEGVLPELVTEDHEGLKSVAYGNLVALIVEAIKEQQHMIDYLKKQLNIK
jgi:hypothetical protein